MLVLAQESHPQTPGECNCLRDAMEQVLRDRVLTALAVAIFGNNSGSFLARLNYICDLMECKQL